MNINISPIIGTDSLKPPPISYCPLSFGYLPQFLIMLQLNKGMAYGRVSYFCMPQCFLVAIFLQTNM
jgi:hypothetical protein